MGVLATSQISFASSVSLSNYNCPKLQLKCHLLTPTFSICKNMRKAKIFEFRDDVSKRGSVGRGLNRLSAKQLGRIRCGVIHGDTL